MTCCKIDMFEQSFDGKTANELHLDVCHLPWTCPRHSSISTGYLRTNLRVCVHSKNTVPLIILSCNAYTLYYTLLSETGIHRHVMIWDVLSMDVATFSWEHIMIGFGRLLAPHCSQNLPEFEEDPKGVIPVALECLRAVSTHGCGQYWLKFSVAVVGLPSTAVNVMQPHQPNGHRCKEAILISVQQLRA